MMTPATARVKTMDVSQNGIGFISDRKISVDDRIAVEVEYREDADSVLKLGRVKWVTRIPGSDCYRFGMQLTKSL